MSRNWIASDLTERNRAVCATAHLLADEACDIELFTDADHLRLAADRLLIDIEEADATEAPLLSARDEARVARERLKRAGDRLTLEIDTRFSVEESALLLTTARLALESSTRYRLTALTPEQRALMSAVVDETQGALDALEAAEQRCFRAAASQAFTKARVQGRGYALRGANERVKAMLLVHLPADGAAYRRISRLVVRTRRPDSWFARKL